MALSEKSTCIYATAREIGLIAGGDRRREVPRKFHFSAKASYRPLNFPIGYLGATTPNRQYT